MVDPADYLVEPLPAHIPHSAPTTVSRSNLLFVAISVMVIVFAVMGILLFVSVSLHNGQRELDRGRRASAENLRTTLLTNRQNGFRTRAAVCESQYVFGLRFWPTNTCMSKDVRRYWDPLHLTAYRAKP